MDERREPTRPEEGVPEELFLEVLRRATKSLEDDRIPYLMIGGIASAAVGRARWTHDIDLFVRHNDAGRAIEALDASGFETRVEHPTWLYKAWLDEVLVDVIFRCDGDIYLDEEMLARARTAEVGGMQLPVAPPEDLVVMKAVAHSEETPRYWHDALSLVGRENIDWDYLARRARAHGAQRVLALLFYARSNDLVIPDRPIARLLEEVGATPSEREP